MFSDTSGSKKRKRCRIWDVLPFLIILFIVVCSAEFPEGPAPDIPPPQHVGVWETFEVPDSRGIHSLAVDSSGVLYAGIWTGNVWNTMVYRSFDWGETWDALYSIPNFYGVTALQVIDGRLYAGTATVQHYGSTHIYINGGLTWILPHSNKTLQIIKINDRLYATTAGRGMMFELLGPGQFDSLKVGEWYDQRIYGLFTQDDTLYAYTGTGTSYGFIYKIIDGNSVFYSAILCGGAIFWIERNDLFIAGSSTRISASPDAKEWISVLTYQKGVSRTGIHFAGSWWIGAGSKVFKSSNGIQWNEDLNYADSDSMCSTIKQIIHYRNIVYVATSKSLGAGEYQGVIRRLVLGP